jgi:quercetin dioxygenase-like cupin family protein
MNNRVWLLAAVFVISPLLLAQSATTAKAPTPNTGYAYWNPEQGQWFEDPDAPGTYGKTVTGNALTGNWVMYAKVRPGAWINWHWHSNPQTLYVVSGTMDYEVKPQPSVKLTPGSYLVILGRALHNGTCVTKEACTFFIVNDQPNDKHMTDASGNELKRR